MTTAIINNDSDFEDYVWYKDLPLKEALEKLKEHMRTGERDWLYSDHQPFLNILAQLLVDKIKDPEVEALVAVIMAFKR